MKKGIEAASSFDVKAPPQEERSLCLEAGTQAGSGAYRALRAVPAEAFGVLQHTACGRKDVTNVPRPAETA